MNEQVARPNTHTRKHAKALPLAWSMIWCGQCSQKLKVPGLRAVEVLQSSRAMCPSICFLRVELSLPLHMLTHHPNNFAATCDLKASNAYATCTGPRLL